MRTDTLIIAGQAADLGTTNIALEFVNNLLTTVDKISTSHSWTLTLPRTAVNDRLLGFAGRPGIVGAQLDRILPAEYYRRGVAIISDGRLYCNKVTAAGYQCVLLWDIFPQLQAWLDAKPMLTDLFLTGAGYTWTGTQTSGDTWMSDNAYEATYDTGVDTMPPTPCANARKIFDAVLDAMGGVTIDDGPITSGLGNGLDRFAIPLTRRVGGMSAANSGRIKATALFKAQALMDPEFELAIDTGNPPVNVLKVIYTDADKFTRYDLSISGSIALANNVKATTQTKLVVCGVDRDALNARRVITEIAATDVANTTSGTTLTFNGSCTLEDMTQYSAIVLALSSVTMATSLRVTVKDTSTFRVNVVTWVKTAAVGDNYEIAENLPEVSQLDFVKFVLAAFGAGLVRGADGALHVVSLDTVKARCGTADAYDWSARLVNATADAPGTLTPTVDGYGARRNWLRWAVDEKDGALDADGYLSAVGDSLDAEATLYEAPFAATDGNHIHQYQLDKDGNVEDVDIAPRFVHVEQGDSGPELFFSGGQRWRNIVASWYGALSSILSAPRTLDVFVRLSEADLAALDMTRPVYLEQTGQWYIIAKVKTDASTDVCSATLVQVNA